jgi:hypothetical protein
MRALAALALALLFALSPAGWRAGRSSPCLAADSSSADLIDDVTNIVAGTDSAFRAQLYLPHVAANQITLVTTDSIRHAAITGLEPNDTTGQAYVFRVGTSAYVVSFPMEYGGNVHFYTLDSTFKLKAIAVI